MHVPSQPRRQRATDYQLTLQSWRQRITFCQSGGKVIVVPAIPIMQFAIMLAIRMMLVPIATAIVAAVIVAIGVLFVSTAVTVSFSLRKKRLSA